MQSPTNAELETAIGVLTKLGERLNTEAAHDIIQMPETGLGAHYAGDIGSQTIERTACISAVSAQLKIWHEESAAKGSWQIHEARKNAAEVQLSEPDHDHPQSWDSRDSFQKARDWLGHKLQEPDAA
jgi:hypothetical protein